MGSRVANGKPFARSDMSKNSRPESGDFEFWIDLNMFFQNQATNSENRTWVGPRMAGTVWSSSKDVWSEQKKSMYTLKFTSSFSPKLLKSLIWNSSPWSHLTFRSNNQASFIQGHLQHLDQGWHDFQGSRAYLLHHSIQLIQPTCFTRLRFLAAAAGAGAKLRGCTRLAIVVFFWSFWITIR